MDKQTKLEDIRRVCIEANPSIKDLVFGCEIKFDNDDEIGIFIMKFLNTYYIAFQNHAVPQTLHANEMPKFEIIGREIRLADVLSAIHKIKQFQAICVSEAGMFISLHEKNIYDVEGGQWNLLNDSLSSQSDETISFLWDLLIGRK